MAAAKKPMPKWTKAPDALVALFERAATAIPQAEPRKMFGYPAAFIKGQMFASLFQSSMILRLSAEDRERFMREFTTTLFEPMPGRVMREYVAVPETVLRAPKVLEAWLARSSEYVASLPAKKSPKRATRGRKS